MRRGITNGFEYTILKKSRTAPVHKVDKINPVLVWLAEYPQSRITGITEIGICHQNAQELLELLTHLCEIKK